MLAADLDVEVRVFAELEAYFQRQDASARELGGAESAGKLNPGIRADLAGLAGIVDGALSPETKARIGVLEAEQRQLDLVLRAHDALASPRDLETVIRLTNELAPSRSEFCTQALESLDKLIQPESARHAQKLQRLLESVNYPYIDKPLLPLLPVCNELNQLNAPLLHAVFARPLAQRVSFHFGEGKDTRDASRPEWLFQYVLTLLTPLHARLEPLASRIDGLFCGLVGRVFPVIENLVCQIYKLNSHTVRELLSFCANLESRLFVPHKNTATLINSLLPPPVLAKYLSLERDNYITSVETAISKLSAETDFDAQVTASKPTFCALGVWQLIRQADYLLRLGVEVVCAVHCEALQTYYRHLLENKENALGPASFIVFSIRQFALEHAYMPLSPLDPVLAQFSVLKLECVKSTASALSTSACTQLRALARQYTQHLELASVRTLLSAVSAEFKRVRDLTSTCSGDRALVLAPVSRDVASYLYTRVLCAHVYGNAAAGHLKAVCTLVFETWRLPPTVESNKLFEGIDVVAGSGRVELLSDEEAQNLRRRVC